MDYKLKELVNLNLFQSILENFNGLLAFPIAIIDIDGSFLTTSPAENICSCFHQSNTGSNHDCIQGVQFIAEHLNEANPAIIYKCPSGLIDCAIPIVIEGRHLGNLIIGQFLPEEADLVFFREQASLLGFDEQKYIEAVKKTPVLLPQQLQKYLAIANSLVELIVDTATKNLEEVKARKKIEESEERFKQLFNTAPDAIFLADTESGIIINANLAAEKLMGQPVQDIIGLHFSDLHPKWNESQTREEFQIHSSNLLPDGLSTVENIILRADGNEVPVEILASTLIVNGRRVIQGIFRDISQRKQIEAQLLTSEEKHRKLAENLPDIISRFDKDFKHLYVNKVVEEFTGIPAESFIGKTNEDLNMPDENVQFWNENLKRVFETGKQQNFEFEFHSDNSIHYFSDLLVPEFDRSGKVTSVLSVARDISKLKKSKNNLRVQRDISIMLGEMSDLDQALKNLLDFCYQLDGIDCGGIYLVDMFTGNIDLVSYFGLSQEFVEQNAHFPKNSKENSVFHQEATLYLSFSDLQDSKQISMLQEKIRALAILPIIYKGRAIAYFNLASRRFNEIPLDDRNVLELIASNLGGTIQRISTENQLKESETKYKLAFHTSPDAINITSLDGLYVDVSAGFTTLMGYTSEEVIGRSSIELNIWVYPEDRGKLISGLNENGKINNLESVFRAKDGSLRTGLMSANIIPINGVPHILSITRDITERKEEINDLMVAKEKAEESNRLKSSFLANLSHELRTPMNGILGFAELLNDDSLSAEIRKEYLSVINDSGQNLLEVITSLMDISKIDSGQIESRIRNFNLNNLLGELFHWFSNEKIMADKSQLELKVIKPLPDEKSNINTDPGKIKHILSLLLKNAAKFSNEGFIHFGYSLQGERIKFFVQDTGKGIRKDKQDAIFDRFRQEDETMTRKYGGVGLGLTIARGLVQLMGGTIGVDSEPGKGSTFWFEIPLHA